MHNELFFVIPTYRLRDVGETVEQYDDHVRRNGHSVRMIVFDDSTPTTQQKYFASLEATRTHNDVYRRRASPAGAGADDASTSPTSRQVGCRGSGTLRLAR